MYSKSQFNHEVPLPGTEDVVCYNFRTRQFARLNPLQQLIFDSGPFDDVSDGFLRSLVEKGMLTEGDEMESLRAEVRKNREDLRRMHLSVDVSNCCNFACVYCLETGELDRRCLSRDTADGVIRFVKYFIDRREIDSLAMIWFGGEPMLNPGIIEYISDALIPYADAHQIPYSAVIYTNGYDLTPANVKMLDRCRVSAARISIDGPGPVHDRYRHLKNGSGTYDRIMENIRSTKSDMVYRIRYNLNRENHMFYEDLVAELKQLEMESGNRIVCSPERMKVEEHVNKALKKIEYTQSEYISVCERLSSCLVREEDSDAFSLLRPKPVPCSACMKYGFCVDVDGNITKCHWIPGDRSKQIIGNVCTFNGSFENEAASRFFLECTVPEKEKCLTCKMLPSCFGRCALEMNAPDRYSCNRLIHSLDNAVLTLYNKLYAESSYSIEGEINNG